MPRKSLCSRSVLRLLALTLINIVSFTGVAHLTPPTAASALLHATPRHYPESIHAKSPAPSQTNQAAQTRLSEAYGKLPLHFEANQGQADAQVKFISRGQGYSLFLTATEAVLALRKAGGERTKNEAKPSPSVASVVRMKLVAANPHSQVSGREPQAGRINYFTGNDARRWRADVPTFARVQYDDVYPGIDLVYYGNQRQLEYDFRLAPGANPNNIRLTFDGANKLETDRATGDLVLHVTEGQVRQHKPVIYQEVNGVKHHVAGRYVLADNQQVSFQIDDYDTTKPLVIDPVIVYSTYLGGSTNDAGTSIAVDDSGNAYITGGTNLDFPTTAGAFQVTPQTEDAFITKLNPTGTAIIYSTYLGGRKAEEAKSIAIDSSGNAYVTGTTASTDFPTTQNALQPAPVSGDFLYGVFVTKLNSDGNALVYSTFLGGSQNRRGEAHGIAVDSSGSAYVVGDTDSGDFPTTSNALKSAANFGLHAFVTKFNAAGSGLLYSTYLNGTTGTSAGLAVALGSSGTVYVTGTTDASDFPVRNAFRTTLGGNFPQQKDAFVTKLDTTREGDASLIYSTFLGGSDFELGYGIAVDASGSAHVVGQTASRDFPTTVGAFQVAPLGDTQSRDFSAFVTKLSAAGNSLVYSTYLGGSGNDDARAIAVDASGFAYVTGATNSPDFPTTPSNVPSEAGGDRLSSGDAFVTRLDPAGKAIVYSTRLGGEGYEGSSGIAVDRFGDVYIVGQTHSSNFPTTPGVVQPTLESSNASDAFIAKITSSLDGRITDLNGNGIAGVVVSLNATGENTSQTATAETDANGYYSFVNAPGGCSISVTASRDGYTFSPSSISRVSSRCDVVFRNEVLNFFGATQAYTISGRVIDSAGNGVSGARLTLTAARQAFTRQLFTDGSGNFLDGGLLAGDNYMLTLADSFTPSGERRFFFPNSRVFNNLNANQTVVFEETVRLTGQVTDGVTGLGGVQVSYSFTTTLTSGGGFTTTTSNGIYTLNLLPGSTGTVSASRANYSFNPPGLRFENLRANTTINFTGTPAMTYNIAGRVLDGGGNGIAFLPVTLNGSQLREVRTDSNGRYTFANVPAIGTYTVRPAQTPNPARPTITYFFKLNTRTFTNLSGNQNADFIAAPFRSPRFGRTRR